MAEPRFTLHAESLLSKWGFGDGDALEDWWWDNFDEEPPFNDHDVLYALVLAHLVPAIEEAGHSVEVFRIHTIHNPVRGRRLDGEEVDSYAGAYVLPIEVSVTREQILAATPDNEGETDEH